MARILVGMSGGVDSAVTAYLLKAAGHDVQGVTLRLWQSSFGKDSRCCEIDDARIVCGMLGIPYHVIQCSRQFRECVTEPFVESYLMGETPNPCIECNRYIKWAEMMKALDMFQADLIATGHYASVEQLENGRYTVQQADSAAKDQTYMLYLLTQEQLAHTVMPLGRLTKEEVRAVARSIGFHVAEKAESMDICFVPDGDYADYIDENALRPVPGEGSFVDEEGNVLGKHKGVTHYTIGQRKGLGIAMGYPVFVKEIRPEENEVVLSREEALFSREVLLTQLNFLSIPDPVMGEKLPVKAKIRYRHQAQAAELEILEDGYARLIFRSPVRAAAPGQSAVFYDEENRVIGGGKIMKNRPL